MTADCILRAAAVLGEGPLWDPVRQLCWWVDIVPGLVHRYDPAMGTDRAIAVGQMVGSVAVRQDGRLLVAAQTGVAVLDPDDESVTPWDLPLALPPDVRFNDGKCDPAGRFWAGTMALDASPGRGTLYCLHPDGVIEVKLPAVTISNGLAWDVDARIMYYVDTATGCVFAFDYDEETGRIANRRVAVRVPARDGMPDGMTIDRDGMLWVAHWGGYNVSRWNPRSGQRIAQVRVPVAYVSSCTFGGECLDQLFITTARDGLAKSEIAAQPLAGSLFCCTPGVQGFEPARFGA